MMERESIPARFKGKALAEVDLDINLEYAEEDVNNGK